MEEESKRVRVFGEEERERRRAAERKRMEDPEYKAAKRDKDRLRMENKEVRERKRAMDRERAKAEGLSERRIEAARKYRETEKFKEWKNKRAERIRASIVLDKIGWQCPVVFVKCLDCGVIETKKQQNVRPGKASSAYCSAHAHIHRRVFGIKPRITDVVCVDCGDVCQGYKHRKVCGPCGKKRADVRKRTHPREIARKKERGGSLRRRARIAGAYIDAVDVNKVHERDKWKCVSCGCKVVRTRYHQPNRATIDHRVPLSKGGSHTYENCHTMCVVCNSKKEASMPIGVQLSVFDRVT